jgi:hypothetical protein
VFIGLITPKVPTRVRDVIGWWLEGKARALRRLSFAA